jgi:hypothetical protein
MADTDTDQTNQSEIITNNVDEDEKTNVFDCDTEKHSDSESDYSDGPSEESLDFDYYDSLEIDWALLAWDKHIKEYTEKNRTDFIVNYMKIEREKHPRRCTNCRAVIRYDKRFCDAECQWENAHKDPGY